MVKCLMFIFSLFVSFVNCLIVCWLPTQVFVHEMLVSEWQYYQSKQWDIFNSYLIVILSFKYNQICACILVL